MVQNFSCKRCSKVIRINYSKAPKDEFTIACPSCSQKYKLKKPTIKYTTENRPNQRSISTNIKKIPCPKCKINLGIDLSKIEKFPAVATCKSCATKIKINDPNVKSALAKNNIDKLKIDSPQLKVDMNKIDPKDNWAYKLYYYTRKINYLNKLTLLIYLSYLTKSVSKTLSDINIEKIDLESFVKLKAEVKVISSNIFNTAVNPILSANGISPKLVSWATGWFINKISARIIIGVVNKKNIDKNLPYIKKFIDENYKKNKIISFFSNQYMITLYFIYFILRFEPETQLSLSIQIFLFLILGLLPLKLCNYKSYQRLKNIFTGNLFLWIIYLVFELKIYLYGLPEPKDRTITDIIFTNLFNFYYIYLFKIIASSALIIDVFEDKLKKYPIVDKINFLYRPKVMIIILLITSTLNFIIKLKNEKSESNIVSELQYYTYPFNT